MVASIFSFGARKLPSAMPWQNQDYAEFYRVRDLLTQTGFAIEVDSGVSDEGDPWFIFIHSKSNEVMVHIARVNREILVIDCLMGKIYRGFEFREVVDQMLDEAPLAIISKFDRKSNVVYHPKMVMTAFVSAAYILAEGLSNSETSQAIASDTLSTFSREEHDSNYSDVSDKCSTHDLSDQQPIDGPGNRRVCKELNQQVSGQASHQTSWQFNDIPGSGPIVALNVTLFFSELLRLYETSDDNSTKSANTLTLDNLFFTDLSLNQDRDNADTNEQNYIHQDKQYVEVNSAATDSLVFNSLSKGEPVNLLDLLDQNLTAFVESLALIEGDNLSAEIIDYGQAEERFVDIMNMSNFETITLEDSVSKSRVIFSEEPSEKKPVTEVEIIDQTNNDNTILIKDSVALNETNQTLVSQSIDTSSIIIANFNSNELFLNTEFSLRDIFTTSERQTDIISLVPDNGVSIDSNLISELETSSVGNKNTIPPFENIIELDELVTTAPVEIKTQEIILTNGVNENFNLISGNTVVHNFTLGEDRIDLVNFNTIDTTVKVMISESDLIFTFSTGSEIRFIGVLDDQTTETIALIA